MLLMDYAQRPDFHIGKASDLQGKSRVFYRFLEMIPGILSWSTILFAILISKFLPVWAAFFIITFDAYWLFKTLYLSLHHYHNYERMQHALRTDWNSMMRDMPHDHVYHMVLLPFFKEELSVIESTILSLKSAQYDQSKMIVVLAAEERGGVQSVENARLMEQKYKNDFGHFVVSVHPQDLPGEISGKGPNISYAAEQAQKHVLDVHGIAHEDILVSAFDIDTVIYPQYFSCLTWYFLTTENPHHSSFQPVPLYNNNVWDAPAFSRVAAMSSTFWQMIQQERPEQLVTFSSHAVSFKSLREVNFWQRNMVSDDSRIFWNLYFANNGNYKVVPIGYPVSMDANLADTFWQTTVNIYKQHRRWMWGVESVPYIIYHSIHNKAIPLRQRLKHIAIQVEGFWSLATNPIFILLLGWLPLILGGKEFNATILSYNLPFVTRNLLIVAMLGLVLSAFISFKLLPPPPKHIKNLWFKKAVMVVQWFIVPVTIIVFGAIPGLDAQTRLMFGRYFGTFWVTPKHRKN